MDDAALGTTTLSTGPLRELVSSLFLLLKSGVRWPYEQWAAGARRILRHDERTFPLQVYRELHLGFPDFLGQAPLPGTNTLADELARLRRTPPEEVHRQLDHYYGDLVPGPLLAYRQNPQLALNLLADAFAAYADGAMRPIWPTVQALTEEEILRRAKAMAQVGADALFDDLHPRIRWRRPALELAKGTELEFAAGERRLQLVPQVFAGDGVMIGEYDPELITLPFQVRGVAALAATRPPADDHDRVGLLLGRGRAAVLRQLSEPTTTRGLAARLAVSPSTVSEHLSVLVSTGMADRQRVGRSVYYQATDAGRALLGLIDRAAVRTPVA